MRSLMFSEIILLLFTINVLFAQQQQEKVINATLISSTSTYKNLPYDIFSGKVWEADPSEKYVRLDILLDKPVWLGELGIEFNNYNHGNVSVYLDDLDNTYSTSYTTEAIIKTDPKKVSSVKFNFERSHGIAIKGIYLKDTSGQKYRIRTTSVVKGTAHATSTLEPARFYDLLKVFDSKLENGWASNKQSKGDTLTFNFAQSQTISAIMIWNGYLRSDVHYQSNSRAKALKIVGDSGYSQELALSDTMNVQYLKLPQEFKGKQFKMVINDCYPGSKYDDLVISELRFIDSNGIPFAINPVPVLLKQAEYNRKQFSVAGFEGLLDNEADGYIYNYPDNGVGTEKHLSFRFRSDGSIYTSNTISKGPKAQQIFTIGNYEVLATAPDSARFRLFGFIVTKTGNGTETGSDCGAAYDYVYKNAGKRIFTEFITVRPKVFEGAQSLHFEFINTGAVKNLGFDTTTVHVNNN